MSIRRDAVKAYQEARSDRFYRRISNSLLSTAVFLLIGRFCGWTINPFIWLMSMLGILPGERHTVKTVDGTRYQTRAPFDIRYILDLRWIPKRCTPLILNGLVVLQFVAVGFVVASLFGFGGLGLFQAGRLFQFHLPLLILAIVALRLSRPLIQRRRLLWEEENEK